MTTRKNIETIQRRVDWLEKTASNDSAAQELSALKWALRQLTATQPVVRRDTSNARGIKC